MTTFYLLLAGTLFIYLYWLLPVRWRGTFLLLGNILFLTTLDERFFLWHLASALLNFFAALLIEHHKKYALASVGVVSLLNVGFIFANRYSMGSTSGYLFSVGVSFYTLINLGYFFDVYRGQIAALKSFRDFYLFSGFFPSVLMGPIERVQNLLPQLKDSPKFRGSFLSEGLFLIALGFFKKFVIADRLHNFVQRDLGFVDQYSGLALWLFCLLALIQIYCDFSAYIDICRGFAKFLGVNLSLNFDRPYLARSVPEIWQRWNITLINWLRSYLFAPLILKTKNFYFTTVVVMMTMALWHETSLSLVMWGIYWSFLYAVHYGLRMQGKTFVKNALISRVLMVTVMSFGSLFFMSKDVPHLGRLLERMFDWTSFVWTPTSEFSLQSLGIVGVGVLVMLGVENEEARQRHAPGMIRQISIALGLLLLVMLFGVSQSQAFIYMRF